MEMLKHRQDRRHDQHPGRRMDLASPATPIRPLRCQDRSREVPTTHQVTVVSRVADGGNSFLPSGGRAREVSVRHHDDTNNDEARPRYVAINERPFWP